MGAQESKIVIDTLSEAYSKAYDQGKDRLEVGVKGPFLNSLKQLWASVPEPTQRAIRGLSTQKRNRKVPKHTSKAIIDHVDLGKVTLWKENPLAFFKENESELVLTEKACTDITKYMTELGDRKGLNEVRFRLLQVIYYRFKERLGIKQIRQRDMDCLTQIFFESGLRGSNASDRVSDWIDQGSRINDLCLAVGSTQQKGYRHLANLFFFDEIACRTIKRLSLHRNGENTERKSLIQGIRKLRDRISFDDRQSLEELTDRLIGAIWDKVEGVISRSHLGWELRHSHSFQIHQTVDSRELLQRPTAPYRATSATFDEPTWHSSGASKASSEQRKRPTTASDSPAESQPFSSDAPPAFYNATPLLCEPSLPQVSDLQYLDLDMWAFTTASNKPTASFNAPSDMPPTSFNAPPPSSDVGLLPAPDFQYLDLDMWAFNTTSNMPTNPFNAPSNTSPVSLGAPSLLPVSDIQYLDLDAWAFNAPSNAPLASVDVESPTFASSHQPTSC
ncbi:hypothetical protein PITC_022130 [Penicillium italicum]|uniref:Uncharacterized protein n=1 Tax=Penicillium italicum TaxID=40296 RepID=A0A0A2LC40_PENIT|nr:hypothetical protein PITC_022130 [Penicillium italicum]